MLKMLKFISVVIPLAVVLVGGWLVIPEATTSQPATYVETGQQSGSGILDGLTFASELGLVGKPADIHDYLVFENGMFVSTECERQCNFPASAYFVRKNGDVTEFVSETRCPYKDATIVWRGSVSDGTIEGIATWTTSRWYWTVEKEIAFEGVAVDGNPPIASAN